MAEAVGNEGVLQVAEEAPPARNDIDNAAKDAQEAVPFLCRGVFLMTREFVEGCLEFFCSRSRKGD